METRRNSLKKLRASSGDTEETRPETDITAEAKPAEMSGENSSGLDMENNLEIMIDLHQIGPEDGEDDIFLNQEDRPQKRTFSEVTEGQTSETEPKVKFSKDSGGGRVPSGQNSAVSGLESLILENNPIEMSDEGSGGLSSQNNLSMLIDMDQSGSGGGDGDTFSNTEAECHKIGVSDVTVKRRQESELNDIGLRKAGGGEVPSCSNSASTDLNSESSAIESSALYENSVDANPPSRMSVIQKWMGKFGNLGGCHLDEVQKLSTHQKKIVFELQSEVVEAFGYFRLKDNPEDPKPAEDLHSAVLNLKYLLKKWKAMTFDESTQNEFIITKEFEETNEKYSEVILNEDFLVFLDQKVSLIELFFLMRLASALCFKLSLEWLFQDEFNVSDE